MANNQPNVNKIRELLQQIFQACNITTFIYIDDVFAFNRLDVEKAIGWFAEALGKDRKQALQIMEVQYPVPDDDIWRRDFRQKWETLPSDEQRQIIEDLKLMLNSQLGADTQVTQQIGRVLPRNLDYKPWSPSDWEEKKEELLSKASLETRVLCLFDQDLQHDIGFSNRGSFSGGGLLHDIVNSKYAPYIVCGILSHTIPSIDDEIEYRNSFASNYDVPDLDTNKFLPLSKSRLHDDTFLKFVDGIKKLILNKYVEDLKSMAVQILDKAHSQAIDRLKKLDAYAFDLIVMTASRKSGVGAWEAETLIRISQIFQRDALRSLLFDSEKATKFNRLIEISRPISEVQVLEEDNTYSWVRAIRRQELYESNSLTKHSPLQVGDIFEKTAENGTTQFFILLAQPCDLTVRAKGSRAKNIVSLIPIVLQENRFHLNQRGRRSLNFDSRSYWNDYWSTRVILDCYTENAAEIAILEFKNAEWLQIDVLDLCVLNANGACQIDLNEEIASPLQLPAGWQRMLKIKIERFTSIRKNLDDIQKSISSITEKSVREILWQSAMPKHCYTNFLPPIPYSDGIFDFKLKRVERYRQPGADSLLKAYMHYMARDAKDFDFTE